MRKRMIFIVILVLIGLLYVVYRQSAVQSEDDIILFGNIELTDVQLSFQLAGKVENRFFSEGDTVEEGALIATLDKELFAQEVALRNAEANAFKAAWEESEHGYLPQELSQAQAKLNQAEADYNRAKSDFQRQKQLMEQNVISAKEFDFSQAAYKIAEEKLQEAKEFVSLLQSGIRLERIEQAKARYEQAQEALNMAKTKLNYTDLKAPFGGIVLSHFTEAGEYVVPGTPILSIGNLKKVWLRAYINERDLGKVKLGQDVIVKTDSYPDKNYKGRISFISSEAEFTPKTIQTQKERVKFVYRIKIDLENENQELKPGMPAEAYINFNEGT